MTLPHRLHFWLWMVAVVLASILCLSILAGCAPYWIRDAEPVPMFVVVEIDTVHCGELSADLLGCADRSTGVIYIKRGLPVHVRDCVETHERKHLAGWSHRPGRPLAMDCGDGRIFP